MLSFIKSRSKQSNADTKRKYATAPGTSIRYSPELIEQLTSEHQDLLNCIIQVIKAAKAFDAPRVGQGLERMRTQLRTHMLSENVRLHLYLKHAFGKDGITGSLVRDFRRDMDMVAREAEAFFERHVGIGDGRYSLNDFLAEFEALGAMINGQMEREECTLFPLYLPEY